MSESPSDQASLVRESLVQSPKDAILTGQVIPCPAGEVTPTLARRDDDKQPPADAAIKLMIERAGVIEAHAATPDFFNALSDFLDLHAGLCGKIVGLDIRLVTNNESDESKSNTFFTDEDVTLVEGVLNELFLRTHKLERITLRYFPPRAVVGCFATIDHLSCLVMVDLQHNSLHYHHFSMALRCFPAVRPLTLDVTNNFIANAGGKCALLLAQYPNVRTLFISRQHPGVEFSVAEFLARQQELTEHIKTWPGQLF